MSEESLNDVFVSSQPSTSNKRKPENGTAEDRLVKTTAQQYKKLSNKHSIQSRSISQQQLFPSQQSGKVHSRAVTPYQSVKRGRIDIDPHDEETTTSINSSSQQQHQYQQQHSDSSNKKRSKSRYRPCRGQKNKRRCHRVEADTDDFPYPTTFTKRKPREHRKQWEEREKAFRIQSGFSVINMLSKILREDVHEDHYFELLANSINDPSLCRTARCELVEMAKNDDKFRLQYRQSSARNYVNEQHELAMLGYYKDNIAIYTSSDYRYLTPELREIWSMFLEDAPSSPPILDKAQKTLHFRTVAAEPTMMKREDNLSQLREERDLEAEDIETEKDQEDDFYDEEFDNESNNHNYDDEQEIGDQLYQLQTDVASLLVT